MSQTSLQTFQFESMGTLWHVAIDSPTKIVPETLWQKLVDQSNEFDQQFSRFIEHNQATGFRHAEAGKYSVSPTLTELLRQSATLRQLSHGLHDPAVGGLLEAAGYDQSYSLQANLHQLEQWYIPQWSIDPNQDLLAIDGPVIFDFGGTGKGYWIDQLSQLLIAEGFPYHLVDGGGDMMATQKSQPYNNAWQIALEWPNRPGIALGTIALCNQGFAASDTGRRSWDEWHHVINPMTKQPVSTLAGCFAIASTAWLADQTTSLLSLVNPDEYEKIGQSLNAQYLVLNNNHQAIMSRNFKVE